MLKQNTSTLWTRSVNKVGEYFPFNLVGLLRKSKFVDNKFQVECRSGWNRI